MFWLIISCVTTSLALGGCNSLKGQTTTVGQYPSKAITFIVPFPAGGSADTIARVMERVAVRHLGQPIVVTNVPGGAATLGWNELAGSKPDGYTIGTVAIGSLLQPLYGPTRYHYPSALDPLIQISDLPVLAVVRADQPWHNVNELVDYVKSHPGEIKYGQPGLGSATSLAGELFVKEAKIDMPQVPFQGDSETIAALLGGHVQVIFVNPPTIKEYVKSGKVKVLGVSKEERLIDPVFKNALTFKEQGYNVVFSFWQGVGAPKGLPADVRARLAVGLEAIVRDPEFIKNMQDLGFTVEFLGPNEFSEKWVAENSRLGKAVVDTGLAERIKAQKK